MHHKSVLGTRPDLGSPLKPKTIKEKVVKRKLLLRHFVYLADDNMLAVTYFIAILLDDL